MATQYLADRNGWLSFRSSTPVLYITAEDDDFDIETMKSWRDEGFIVKYIPFGSGGKQYVNTLYKLGDGMGIGERYAIVGINPSLISAHRNKRIYFRDIMADFIFNSLRRCSSRVLRNLFRTQDCHIETLFLGGILPKLDPGYTTSLYLVLPCTCSPRGGNGWQ